MIWKKNGFLQPESTLRDTGYSSIFNTQKFEYNNNNLTV